MSRPASVLRPAPGYNKQRGWLTIKIKAGQQGMTSQPLTKDSIGPRLLGNKGRCYYLTEAKAGQKQVPNFPREPGTEVDDGPQQRTRLAGGGRSHKAETSFSLAAGIGMDVRYLI